MKKLLFQKASRAKELSQLWKQVWPVVAQLDIGFLKRIDGLEPKRDVNHVSYRYPFVTEEIRVSPVDFEFRDSILGNMQGSVAAVQRLISAVRNELRLFERKPK